MTVYNYIADNNPNKARNIIDSFGYDVVNTSDLGRSLTELVSNEGEPALKAVMQAHPDKDIILELFGDNSPSLSAKKETKSCGCSGCSAKNHQHPPQQHYMNASGPEGNNTMTLANQTNVILIVASLFIATALIIKKN